MSPRLAVPAGNLALAVVPGPAFVGGGLPAATRRRADRTGVVLAVTGLSAVADPAAT